VHESSLSYTAPRTEGQLFFESRERVSRISLTYYISIFQSFSNLCRQTQAINPKVLPVTPKNYRVQKKADYTFSFHRNSPQISDLYDQLYLKGLGDRISQTTDANTKRLALFSGIEVKQENGGKDEALAQLAIWLAAGLENVRRLGELSQRQQSLGEELHPVVGWTVIGHDWHTYIAYRVNQGGRDTFVSVS